MASMATLAIMSLRPPSGLNQPTRRQNSFDSIWRFNGGGPAISAQQRHSPGGEVAAVITALDRAGHTGAMSSRLRSTLINHASHDDRSPGGLRSFSAHAASHASSQRRTSMPFIESVPTTEHMIAVNPGAVLAVGAERQPSPYGRTSKKSFGAIVIQRHLRAVDEHAQPFAMVQQRTQRLALARRVR